MRIFQTAAAVVALSCASTASIFPFPQHAQRDALAITAQAAQETNVLVARQASKTSFDLSFSGPQGNTATTRTGSSATGSTSGGSSGDATGSSQTAKGSGTKAKSSHQVTKTFDPRLPAGGLQMITPAPTAAPSYYKILNYVTFAWNYTSLSVTPSAVDVLATCTVNSQLYTIALNQSITASTQAITWDTNAYQSSAPVQLLTGEYTLIVHDSSKDISAMASAGYLATFQNFRFGMYVPQAYKDLADWQCVTCNSAMSNIEKQTLTMVCGMAALCVLSFSWFSSVAGLW